MILVENRMKDLETLFRNLDISTTMYKNAVDKYNAIASYLETKGIKCDIYPQGSFALGLVTRPVKKEKDVNYDLDVICELVYDKEKITPEYLKHLIGNALKESQTYKDRLIEYDKCWTLEFAEINEIAFNMDIIPSVEDKKTLSFYFDTNFLAITSKNEKDDYDWITINPKDYQSWFENINKPFLDYCQDSEKRLFMESYKTIYNKVEEIPPYFIKSPLQRVIQLLKRQRDIYFSAIKKEDKKPISAIITTLCSQIGEKANKNISDVELLTYIVSELDIYSKLMNDSEELFNKTYSEKVTIKKRKNKWEILNPVNPEDNLADSWNDDKEKAELFFGWIKNLQKTFLGYKEINDKEFFSILESSLGSTYVNKYIERKKYEMPVASVLSAHKKSWGY